MPAAVLCEPFDSRQRLFLLFRRLSRVPLLYDVPCFSNLWYHEVTDRLAKICVFYSVPEISPVDQV